MESEELRRILVKVSGEAAGLLRDIACTTEASTRVGEETFKADLISEEYIMDALKREGINGRFVSEERGVIVDKGDYTILIDPLDGSRNYANCIPWSSVSIAIADSKGRSLADVIAGVVTPVFYGDPVSFSSNGCYMGATRISPPQESEKFIYVYVEHPEAAVLLAEIIGILGRGFKVRSLGSAALEITYVSIGRGKAFIDLRPKLRNIDVAAAIGLARTCGGKTTGPGGAIREIPIDKIVRLDTLAVFSRDVPDEIISKISKGPLSSAGQSSSRSRAR